MYLALLLAVYLMYLAEWRRAADQYALGELW